MAKARINHVGIVSDLHCGSRWGLRYKPNLSDPYTTEADLWLYACWKSMVDSWPSLDLLILNGDMIDGPQRKSEGTGLITTNMSEQTETAIECLESLVKKAKKVIRIAGTAHHESFHGPLTALDATFKIKKPDPGKSMVRDIYLDGSPEDDDSAVILNIKHNPEGQRTLYQGTTLDREARWAALAEMAHAIPRADIIVRSHIHFASDFTDYAQGKTIITTPCFCMQQPYAIEKKYYGWKPVIGGLLLERDGLSFRGWKHLVKSFRLPKIVADTFSQL